jgi:hypothetical protein
VSLAKFGRNARAALLLGGALTCARAARADEAEDLFRAGLQAEQRLEFAAADDAYARALALRPSASFAHRARIRLDDLRGHAEGGYAPLARLESVRRSRELLADPQALEALHQEARAFPTGRVQAEALLLVAEAFTHRLNDPQRALAPASLLVNTTSLDRPLRARGLDLLVESHRALGQPDRARAALTAHPGLSPALERETLASDRRERLRRVALAVSAALGLAALLSLWKLRRMEFSYFRRLLLAPTSLAVGVFISLGGVGLAWLFDESLSLRPFVLLGPAVVAVDRSVALASQAHGSARPARVALALLGVSAVAAAAFLILLTSDPSYLASFGL